MTRMESIRKQYEGTATSNPQTGGRVGRPYQPRPRHRFWLWFWLIVLAAITIGFLTNKKLILEKVHEWSGGETEAAPMGMALGGHQGATQDAHQGATQDAHQGAHQGAVVTVTAKDAAVAQYFQPSEAELSQLFEYVRSAANVKENLQYAGIMKDVRFFYLADNDTVNAYASLKKLNKDKDELHRVIVLLGGAVRFCKVASLAVAAHLSGDKQAPVRLVRTLEPADCDKLDLDAVVRLVNAANLGAALANETVQAKAKSVSAGMILGILAHEAGHHALGHTLNTSEKVNLDISRNQEREADSFASSVIASSPFGEYILAGTLFWHFALASQQGDAVATTHPLSKERFENFVRANAELAASMGITLDKKKGR